MTQSSQATLGGGSGSSTVSPAGTDTLHSTNGTGCPTPAYDTAVDSMTLSTVSVLSMPAGGSSGEARMSDGSDAAHGVFDLTFQRPVNFSALETQECLHCQREVQSQSGPGKVNSSDFSEDDW